MQKYDIILLYGGIAMKKVRISISVNSVYFSFTNKVDEQNINQTSYIETGSLVFEYDYLVNNTKIMTSFIADIINKTKINTLKIKNIELVPIVLKIVKSISTIKKLYILDDKIIDANCFLTIVDNKNINYLNCYHMPTVMFNYLNSRKDILIELRNEVAFSSKFMNDNKLTKYSTIYYKKSIQINNELTEADIRDLDAFLLINKHLQVINVKKYNFNTIDIIFKLLNKYEKQKIKVNIHQNKTNIDTIFNDANELKKLKNKQNNIKVVYDKEYILKNFVKQINVSMLRFSFLAICIALLIILGITEYTSCKEDDETTDIVNNINEIVEFVDDDETTNIMPEIVAGDEEFLDDTDQVIEETTSTTTQKPNAYKTKYEKVFAKLKEINPDTVGWLTVKNTSIDYPVVQSTDNSYYLKRSFDNKTNSRGWIFADYRNSFDTFDDNTIIYGHNLKSGYMFGTLQKVLDSKWYNNIDNRTITFNTVTGNYSWQIFSIYTDEKNNDYLVSTFANETNFNNYIKKAKEKSIIDFGIDVKYGDKILTLSTCYINSNNRLVVQAKLVK